MSVYSLYCHLIFKARIYVSTATGLRVRILPSRILVKEAGETTVESLQNGDNR